MKKILLKIKKLAVRIWIGITTFFGIIAIIIIKVLINKNKKREDSKKIKDLKEKKKEHEEIISDCDDTYNDLVDGKF